MAEGPGPVGREKLQSGPTYQDRGQVQPDSATPLGYVPGLDGLRAIAVTLVIAAHLGIRPLDGGTIGVHIFFVLSGFLITSLLLQEGAQHGNIALGVFYARRALRLLPAMLIVVVATDAYMAIDAGNAVRSSTLTATPSVLFYYANWRWVAHGDSAALGWFGHMWSLAVEEQFYLVWPLLLIVVIRGRWSTKRLVWVLLLACAASLGLRTWAATALAGGFFGTPMVAEMLLWGALAAVLLRAARPAVELWAARLQWLSVAYLAVYLVVVPTGLYNDTIGSGPALSGVAISTRSSSSELPPTKTLFCPGCCPVALWCFLARFPTACTCGTS